MAQTGSATIGNVQYNGPGMYTSVNSNGLAGGVTQNQPIVYLIGSSVGGQPGQILRLTSENQARTTLKGGDLLNAYLFARKHGAGEVDVFRVDPAVQSSLLLHDASSNPSILLTSVDYGAYTNSFQASISGSSGNLTATFVDVYDGVTLTSSPNPLGPALTVTYSGNGTAATLTIVHSMAQVGTVTVTSSSTGGTIAASTTVDVQVVARNASGYTAANTGASVTTGSSTATNSVSASWTGVTGATSYDVYVNSLYYGNTTSTSITITYVPSGTAAPPTVATDGPNLSTSITGQTDSSVNLDVSLAASNVLTVSALASYIAGQIGYGASVSKGAGGITSIYLDSVTATSITGTGALLTADVAAVINWFNNTGYVTATQPSGATSAPAAVGLTPFTGGSDGTVSGTNWQNAAGLIGSANPQLRYPVALTDNAVNYAYVSSGITTAATKATTRFARGFFGGGTSDSDSTAEQNAASIGGDRNYFAAPDFYDNDSNGVYTHFPAYMMGAVYAGLAAGNNPAQPLTNQIVQVMALGGLDSFNQPMNSERALALAQAGVSAAYVADDGNIRIYQGISTDQISGDQLNTYKVEFSVGNAVDQVRIYIATNLSAKYRGGMNYGSSTQSAILAEINSLLKKCVSYGWISGYTPATQLSPSPTNSTFLVSNGTINVVNPINGIVFEIDLALPVLSSAA